MMNRRTFLASLFALPAAVKAACSRSELELTLDSIFEKLSALKKSRDPPLTHFWMQTTRRSVITSPEYDDAINIMMAPRGSAEWRGAHVSRARRKLVAEQKIPAPNLP